MEVNDEIRELSREAMGKIFTDFLDTTRGDEKYNEMARLAIDAKAKVDAEANADYDRDLKYEQLDSDKEKHASEIKVQSDKLKLETDKFEADTESEKYQRGIEDDKNRIEEEAKVREAESAKHERRLEYVKLGASILTVILNISAHRADMHDMSNLEINNAVIPRLYTWKIWDKFKIK